MKPSRRNRTRFGVPAPLPAARGAATLVVVMMLFFVVAMVAAYTSRNLIFEQKTSANQYRSTIAFEAAEAGAEWALAMLNGGVIGSNCTTTAPPDTSFQQRYLTIDTSLPGGAAPGGVVTNRLRGNPLPVPPDNPLLAPALWPACSVNGNAWGGASSCKCPTNTADAPTASNRPAFRVWISRPPAPSDPATSPLPSPAPGRFRLQVNGCTSMPASDGDCLAVDPQPISGDAVASVNMTVALRSSIASMPAAAVTAQGSVSVAPAGAEVRVVNTDPAVNGVTVHAGSAATLTGINAVGVAGTPGPLTWVTGDTRLAGYATLAPGADPVIDSRMFIAQFGSRLPTYRDQPGVRRCPSAAVATCTAATLQALLDANPNRVLWVEGDVTLNDPLGSVDAPALVVVHNGTLTLGPNAHVIGLVYLVGVGPPPLQARLVAPSSSNARITGALVSGGNLQIDHPGGVPSSGNGLLVSYDRAVLNVLRTSYGSWVRLPGGWRDFKD
jgi:Tfp pilus assembly protein PilX